MLFENSFCINYYEMESNRKCYRYIACEHAVDNVDISKSKSQDWGLACRNNDIEHKM